MNKILYLGLEVPSQLSDRPVIHCPLIQVVPRPATDPYIQLALASFTAFTHLVFTSKSAVSIFLNYALASGIDKGGIQEKCLLAVGQQTAHKLLSYDIYATFVAEEETAEGVIATLSRLDLTNANILWPHSALSRPIISSWLESQNIKHCACIFYDTITRKPERLPNLASVDEIIFTSPSTVDAFIECFGALPTDKILTCIGPITQRYLKKYSQAPQ